MSFYVPYSMFNLENVTNVLGSGVSQIEQQMEQQLSQLNSNPNPSPQALASFQAILQIWSSMINMESSIIKTYGDTMKQVVTNMGA